MAAGIVQRRQEFHENLSTLLARDARGHMHAKARNIHFNQLRQMRAADKAQMAMAFRQFQRDARLAQATGRFDRNLAPGGTAMRFARHRRLPVRGRGGFQGARDIRRIGHMRFVQRHGARIRQQG